MPVSLIKNMCITGLYSTGKSLYTDCCIIHLPLLNRIAWLKTQDGGYAAKIETTQ